MQGLDPALNVANGDIVRSGATNSLLVAMGETCWLPYGARQIGAQKRVIFNIRPHIDSRRNGGESQIALGSRDLEASPCRCTARASTRQLPVSLQSFVPFSRKDIPTFILRPRLDAGTRRLHILKLKEGCAGRLHLWRMRGFQHQSCDLQRSGETGGGQHQLMMVRARQMSACHCLVSLRRSQ